MKKIINSLKTISTGNEQSMAPTMIFARMHPQFKPIPDAAPADAYQKFLQQQKAAFFFKLERELEKVINISL